jgi:predicted DNA-binding protein (UPF0278 family)
MARICVFLIMAYSILSRVILDATGVKRTATPIGIRVLLAIQFTPIIMLMVKNMYFSATKSL